jgi:E3 ubiquitin-protein ligase MGRN1
VLLFDVVAGDMADLNHLARVPGVVAKPPENIKHTNTVRSLCNLRKESVRLVHHADASEATPGGSGEAHLEFVFDSDVPCTVAVYFFATEVVDAKGEISFISKVAWPIRRFVAGMGQLYSYPDTPVRCGGRSEHELFIDEGGPRQYPIVIVVEAEVDHPQPHFHTTFGTFEGGTAGPHTLTAKPVVQRVTANGLSFLLKEIYGIEDKGATAEDASEEDNTECVVCISDVRDTMALPCRHLCLCNPCAEVRLCFPTHPLCTVAEAPLRVDF